MDNIGLLVLTEHSYSARPPVNSLRQSSSTSNEAMLNDDNMEPVEVLEGEVEVIAEVKPRPYFTPRPHVPVTRDPAERNEGSSSVPWAKLRKILNQLAAMKHFIAFLQPVDPVACDVLNYYDIIRSPMDLETIAARMQNKYYRSVREWVADFQLMFSNCLEYNEDPSSNIRVTAGEAMNTFEDKLEANRLKDYTDKGKRKRSKTNQKHLQNYRTARVSSSSDSDVEFLESFPIPSSSGNTASPGVNPANNAETSSSTVSVTSSEDLREMPKLTKKPKRVREERTTSFSSCDLPQLFPFVEGAYSSTESSPKLQLQITKVEQNSYSETDVVDNMDTSATEATSHTSRDVVLHRAQSSTSSLSTPSKSQGRKHAKPSKRRRKTSSCVSSAATTEALAAMPPEKNGIFSNGESTVTKSGRKILLTKRFGNSLEPEAEVEIELPSKLKYYKQFIVDMFGDSKLKNLFRRIFRPRLTTPAMERLREIKRNLDDKKYARPEELEEDMRLLLQNKGDATNKEEAMDFERFEQGWNKIMSLWEPDLAFEDADFFGFFDPDIDPLDDREWTTSEIQDLLQKLGQLPLGKMGTIISIMRHSETNNCPVDKKHDMVARVSFFKPKSLNDIRKEVDRVLAAIMKEKVKEAADRAMTERKLKQREMKEKKLKMDDPTEEVLVETNVISGNSPGADGSSSSSSSDSDSSSGSESSSSSSSSGTETDAEDRVTSEPAKQKKKKNIKSLPKKTLIYTKEVVLSEPESSDDETSRSPRKVPSTMKASSSSKGVPSTGTSNCAARSDPEVLKSTKPSGTQKDQKAPSPTFAQPTISFGIIKVPLESPGQQVDKRFGAKKPEVETELEELPALSIERKAMREEAALLRKKHANNIDPIKMQELVDAFSTHLAYVGGDVYVRDDSVLDALQIGFLASEKEDLLQDFPAELPKKLSYEPREGTTVIENSLDISIEHTENLEELSVKAPKIVSSTVFVPTKCAATQEIPKLRQDQNFNDLLGSTGDADNLKYFSANGQKVASPIDWEPTMSMTTQLNEKLRNQQNCNIDEDSGDEVDMDGLDFAEC